MNYYGKDCEIFCLPNEQRYDCDLNTGQKICKNGYFGPDCLSGKNKINKIEKIFYFSYYLRCSGL